MNTENSQYTMCITGLGRLTLLHPVALLTHPPALTHFPTPLTAVPGACLRWCGKWAWSCFGSAGVGQELGDVGIKAAHTVRVCTKCAARPSVSRAARARATSLFGDVWPLFDFCCQRIAPLFSPPTTLIPSSRALLSSLPCSQRAPLVAINPAWLAVDALGAGLLVLSLSSASSHATSFFARALALALTRLAPLSRLGGPRPERGLDAHASLARAVCIFFSTSPSWFLVSVADDPFCSSLPHPRASSLLLACRRVFRSVGCASPLLCKSPRSRTNVLAFATCVSSHVSLFLLAARCLVPHVLSLAHICPPVPRLFSRPGI